MISIEKEKVKKVFHEYTDHYDLTDDKVRLKVEHTYRVADLCERTRKFANILRDADKIDILKVNVDFSLEKIDNTTTEKLLEYRTDNPVTRRQFAGMKEEMERFLQVG